MEVWLSWTAVSLAALCGYWLKLHYAHKHGTGRAGRRAMEDEVAQLRAELQGMYDDLAARLEQLAERADFVERVLADSANRPRLDPPPPPHHARPKSP